MIRTAVLAAAAATLFALTSPGPAQAAMARPALANPALSSAVPSAAEHVQYYYGPRRHRHRGYYGHRPYRAYGYRPYRAYGYRPGYRRCWTVFNGYRYVRRCR